MIDFSTQYFFLRLGMGYARTRLRTFMTENSVKNKGLGQKIVQSDAFLTLFNAVVSSQDIAGSNPTPEQLKMNNPKLSKLDDILKEHFERSRAVKSSSRAIVFSQWRDSVEEIVNVLLGSRPLLQPMKFVGQGSGSVATADGNESKTNGKRSSSKVAGMKQAEQQRVIKDFRDGKYNILVCTW